MQKEIWKPIPSKPGMRASNFGRVCLPESTAAMYNGGFRKYSPKPTFGSITRAKKGAAHEYMGMQTRMFGNLKIHRLICEAFHGPPPFPKAVVIHKDEDGKNNRPSNLKWGTQKENLNMPKFLAYCKSRTGENNPRTKGIKNQSNQETP